MPIDGDEDPAAPVANPAGSSEGSNSDAIKKMLFGPGGALKDLNISAEKQEEITTNLNKSFKKGILGGTRDAFAELGQDWEKYQKKAAETGQGVMSLLANDLKKEVSDFGKNIGDALKETIGDIKMPDGIVNVGKDLGDIIEKISGSYDLEIGAKIVGIEALEKSVEKITESKPLKIIAQIEAKTMQDVTSTFDNFKGTWLAGADKIKDANGVITTSTMSTAIATETYAKSLNELRQNFGLTRQSSDGLGQSVGAAGISIGELDKLAAKTVDTTGKVAGEMKGLSAIYTAAASTGLDTGDAVNYISTMLKELNVSSEDAVQNIEMFSRTASGTKLPIGEVSKAIMEQSSQFSMFGNNINSASGLFRAFTQTLGEGERALAKPLFNTVMNGIKNMDTGLRAFLGLTTSIGTGGGGAIGGALEVEEALSKGTGIEKVMEGITETIERMTGAPVMTRQEAISTGRQQEYFMQRQMVQQQLKVGSPEEADRIMKMMQGRDIAGFKQQVAPDTGAGGGFRLATAQEAATVEAGGLTNKMINALDATTDSLKTTVGVKMFEAAQSFNGAGTILKKVSDQLSKVMDPESRKAMKLTAAEEQARKAKERLLRGDQAETLKDPTKTLQAQLTRAEITRRAGARTVEEQTSTGETVQRTGAETLEGLTEMADVIARTQEETLESALNWSDVYLRTQAESLEYITNSAANFAAMEEFSNNMFDAFANAKKSLNIPENVVPPAVSAGTAPAVTAPPPENVNMAPGFVNPAIPETPGLLGGNRLQFSPPEILRNPSENLSALSMLPLASKLENDRTIIKDIDIAREATVPNLEVANTASVIGKSSMATPPNAALPAPIQKDMQVNIKFTLDPEGKIHLEPFVKKMIADANNAPHQ